MDDWRARVEAAIRLISPDHITPIGARHLRAALAAQPTKGEQPPHESVECCASGRCEVCRPDLYRED